MFLLQAWLRRSPRDCQSASIAASTIISWPSSALHPLESPQPAQLKQAEPQPVSLTHSPLLQGLIFKTSFGKLFPFNREGNTFSGFSGLNLWCCICVCIRVFVLWKKKKNEPHIYLRFSSTPEFQCSNLTWFEAYLSFEKKKTCWPQFLHFCNTRKNHRKKVQKWSRPSFFWTLS